MYKYLSRAVITPEGIKNFQKQKPTALKVGIAKFAESGGGKLESWYSILLTTSAGQLSTIPTTYLQQPQQ